MVGYSELMANALAQICSNGTSLPQGGVTSPAISNLVSVFLDRRISGLCTKEGLVYTRYADDMAFSANDPGIFRRILPLIKSIVASEGFSINDKKTRLGGPYSRCAITSLVKNSSEPTFSVGRCRLRKIRAEICRFNKWSVPSNYYSAASIEGIVAFVESISEKQGQSLRRLIAKGVKQGGRLAQKT